VGPIWITEVQQISSWIASNDIPNWATLIAELVFGGVITTIVYRLQSKTSKLSREIIEKIAGATRKIDSYVEEKKNLEEGRKKTLEIVTERKH
jgi:hypothetical protein